MVVGSQEVGGSNRYSWNVGETSIDKLGRSSRVILLREAIEACLIERGVRVTTRAAHD